MNEFSGPCDQTYFISKNYFLLTWCKLRISRARPHTWCNCRLAQGGAACHALFVYPASFISYASVMVWMFGALLNSNQSNFSGTGVLFELSGQWTAWHYCGRACHFHLVRTDDASLIYLCSQEECLWISHSCPTKWVKFVARLVPPAGVCCDIDNCSSAFFLLRFVLNLLWPIWQIFAQWELVDRPLMMYPVVFHTSPKAAVCWS